MEFKDNVIGSFISFINMTRLGSYKRSHRNLLLLDYVVCSCFFFGCNLTQYLLFINCVIKLKHRKTFQKFYGLLNDFSFSNTIFDNSLSMN